jgi:hypothetical protein
MTRIFSLFAVLLCATLLTSTTSCTKTNTNTIIKTEIDTLTVIQKDTITIKDTTLTTAILTANSWKELKVKAELGGNFLSYTRGGSGNTIPLDNLSITFNSNGSGTYVDNSGVVSTFTWSFTDATNSTIIWYWNNAVPATVVTWENIVYKNASISYTEFYTYSGQNALSDETIIPK